MSDPVKLQILKAMTSSLQEITCANGFEFDLATSVFRGRLVYGDNDPIPMVSILEAPIPMDKVATSDATTTDAGGWELLVQGFVKDDRENPTDPAHMLMADVKKQLVLEKRKSAGQFSTTGPFGLGKFITSMYIGQGVVRPPEDHVSAKAYFWLGVRLAIVEDLAGQ